MKKFIPPPSDPSDKNTFSTIGLLLQQAIACHQQGNVMQAQTLYEEILSQAPEQFDALHMMGVLAMQKGENQRAVFFFLHAIRVQSRNGIAHSNCSNALARLQRYAEAFNHAQISLRLMHDYDDALINCGVALEGMGRPQEAIQCYDRVLQVTPDAIVALFNRGNALQELGRFEEAVRSFDAVIQRNPHSKEAHFNKANGLRDLRLFEAALSSYGRALQIDPTFVKAINNRANVFREWNRHDEALAEYDRALQIQPDYPDALINRGNALRDLLRHQEAMTSYDMALKLDPYAVDAHWNEALCRLMHGDFAIGLEKYEWRWKLHLFKNKHRHFVRPLWLGNESLHGKTVLLHAEQGFGDTIQFCRYATMVSALGAKVILEVQPELKRQLSHLDGASLVVARGEPLPEYDFHCPLLSLPLAFRTGISSIPSQHSYLYPDNTLAMEWGKRLDGHRRPLIGLAWSGSVGHVNDYNRSMPLANLTALVDGNATFFSLQKEVRAADKVTLEQHIDIIDIGGSLIDFADTAAFMSHLDLIITADTAVAHLAGALGKPVWILLPYCPDWRWLLNRNDSPWYPTVRLFRQSAIGDWQGVINALALALQDWREAGATIE